MTQESALLDGTAVVDRLAQVATTPPYGLDGLIETFGDIRNYIGPTGDIEPRWPSEILELVSVPFPLRLSWAPQTEIRQFRCHRKLAGTFSQVFGRLQAANLAERVQTFGGCYAFRAKRGARRLSTHSWGIAIDLNPESNALGSKGDMDSAVVDVFRQAGFVCGGQWDGPRKDPMHFQFCMAY